jgi:CheY-like chemotaxis protein
VKHVLLVEDENDYREILADQMRQLGIVVTEAPNGKIALDLLTKSNADLILLDLMMPVMDGKTFLKHLFKTSYKETPVIILTNLSQSFIPNGLQFIMKAETDLDTLLRLIRSKLRGKKLSS